MPTPAEKLSTEILLAFMEKHGSEIPDRDTLQMTGGADVAVLRIRRDGKVLRATIVTVEES